MKAFLASIAPSLIDNVIGPLLLAGLTWASFRLAGYIKAHTKNARVQGILLRLNDATFTAVSSLEQTVVNTAKASSSNGKLTEYTGKCVKSAALESIKAHLGAQGIAELKKILGVQDGDLDAFLSQRIESSVLGMPSQITTVATPLVVPEALQKPVPTAVDSSEEVTGTIRK